VFPLSSQHRYQAELATNVSTTTVLFIVTVPQASSVNVNQMATTMQSSIASVAASSTGLNVTAQVVSSASVITPTSTVPLDTTPTSSTPNATPPPVATPTPPATPGNAASSDSLTIGVAVGVSVGGIVLIALGIVVGKSIAATSTAATTTTTVVQVNVAACGDHNGGNRWVSSTDDEGVALKDC
jgi:hypothetical protein